MGDDAFGEDDGFGRDQVEPTAIALEGGEGFGDAGVEFIFEEADIGEAFAVEGDGLFRVVVAGLFAEEGASFRGVPGRCTSGVVAFGMCDGPFCAGVLSSCRCPFGSEERARPNRKRRGLSIMRRTLRLDIGQKAPSF